MRPMTQPPAYWRDSYHRTLKTRVLSSGNDDEGPWIELEDSVLYPPGGGQPADRGWIGDIEIEAIDKSSAGFRIRVDRIPPSSEVELKLDWARRYDHMQQHTAQHLLTSVAEDRFGWTTTAFHLGAEVSDIELDVSDIGPQKLAKLEEEVNAVAREGRPVSSRSSSPEVMSSEGIRCRGLPESHEGDVRIIEIEGIDVVACGGTHLRSTAEIGSLCLLGTERMRGGTRLRFIAGGRVLDRMGTHEARLAQLRRLLDASDADLVSILQAKLDQLQDEARRVRKLTDDLTTALAEASANSKVTVQAIHFSAHGKDVVYGLARKFAAAASSGWLMLTADDGSFALVSAEPDEQLPLIGQDIADILDGRGGGKGQVFQGKANALGKRDQAEEELRKRLKGRS